MVDVDKVISIAARTGKLTYGFKESMVTLRGGKAKLFILAKNCPPEKEKEISRLTKILNVPLFQYKSSSMDLGMVCGKPFPVSVIVVREAGDSEILNLVKV